jgi:phytoene dehydrogenase-like protein
MGGELCRDGMTPLLSAPGTRSPVENVYLCGSGSHPGPGRNAAEAICSDLGLDFTSTVATGATGS